MLQKKLEQMEERNDRLEAELFNVNAENFELKMRLDAGMSNVKAENSELKTRLTECESLCHINRIGLLKGIGTLTTCTNFFVSSG